MAANIDMNGDVSIPPEHVIDALRNELAVAKDEITTLKIKLDYQRQVIAELNQIVDHVAGAHTHDDTPQPEIARVGVDDAGVQVISGDDGSE